MKKVVTVKLVDESNFSQVIALSLSEDEQHFVASNLRSLAECWLYRENGDVVPYAIYAEDTVVGFALVDLDDETATYMIWRLMIDKNHQGNGYGRRAIQALIAQAKQLGNYRFIRADFVKGNHKMEQLLDSLDFTIFGQDDREIYTKYIL